MQPCAYLHNYRKKEYDDLVDLCYEYYLDKAPVFTRGDTKKLAMFIARYVKKGNPDVMYHIDSGKIKPSKSLQDSLTNMLKGKLEFTLLDEQKVTYEKALAIAKENSARKQVYIIHGGPGTGKTVIAVNMLVELINRDKNTIYVIGDSHTDLFTQNKISAKKFLGQIEKKWFLAANYSCAPKIIAYHLDAVLAYSLGKKGTSNKVTEKIEYLLKGGFIPPGSLLILSFGEIDCRVHVKRQAEINKVSQLEVILNIINN